MIYFKECNTIDEVKTRYKTLAKIFHPDMGGTTELMQALNAEYALACANILKGENLSTEDTESNIRVSEEIQGCN